MTFWFVTVQVAASLVMLTYFVFSQLDRVDPSSYHYLASNFLSGIVLTVTAVIAREWGFVLLEGCWSAVSAWSLVQRSRGRSTEVTH